VKARISIKEMRKRLKRLKRMRRRWGKLWII